MSPFRSGHYRTTRALIHLDALENNWKSLAARIPATTKVLPVVKANGYGHGSLTIAKECARLGAVGMGVADVGEALALRDGGYDGEIMSFGEFSKPAVSEAERSNIIFTIHSWEEIENVLPSVKRWPTPLRTHLEIETGMHRLGIEPEDWENVAARLVSSKEIRVEGIFSHFSESESSDRSFSEQQMKAFELAVAKFEKAFGRRLIRHIANSGGALAYPSPYYDWVRPGIVLYGYPPKGIPSRSGEFRPVLEWRAPLIQIKRIARGDRVGYNRVFHAPEKMTIGTVAVGYGDGYRRGFAEAGAGYRGERRKIVGSVCMDLLMIDLTGLPDPRVGDEVILMGDGTQGDPTAVDLADAEKTVPYQVLTGISARVGRETVLAARKL